MIFRPIDPNARLWDTMILPWDGKFYLFYLEFRKEYWDGYALATSEDLVHWTDHGNIMDLGPGSGSGVPFRVGDEWVMSLCKLDAKGTKVCFAKSKDLFHWEPLPDEYSMYPDSRWYDAGFRGRTSSRYDSMMWVERQPDGTYAGLFTGTILGGPTGGNGCVATATSPDGIHWEPGPPANEPCGMGWAELVDHCEFNGRHYVLVGNAGGMGRRIDRVYNTTGKSGGMYAMVADRWDGPYVLCDGDPLLLGCRNAPANWAYLPTYSTSTFKFGEKTLVNHHWMPRQEFTDAQLGTCKELVETSPGRLALRWWEGNEALKGRLIFDLAVKPAITVPHIYELPTGTCSYTDRGMSAETETTVVAHCATESFEKGIFVEAVLSIHGESAGGIFFGNTKMSPDRQFEGNAILFNTTFGVIEFGAVISNVCSPAFMPESHVTWPIAQDEDINLRLLIKGEFIEAYVDDKLVHCYGYIRPVTNCVGLFAECERVDLKAIKIWEFDL